jgi:hypothetical protein
MIIISMDSHTELVANLRPFLPHKWHGEFDEGEVLARRYFSKVIDSFGPFVAAGNSLSEVGFTALPDSGRPLAIEEYVRPLPINERLAMIDADGVAAEFITPFIGPLVTTTIFCMNARWPIIAILRTTCPPPRSVSLAPPSRI